MESQLSAKTQKSISFVYKSPKGYANAKRVNLRLVALNLLSLGNIDDRLGGIQGKASAERITHLTLDEEYFNKFGKPS